MDPRYEISDGQPRGIPKGFPIDIASKSDLTSTMLQVALHFSRSGQASVDPRGLIWDRKDGLLRTDFYNLLFERKKSNRKNSAIFSPIRAAASQYEHEAKPGLRFPEWVLAHNAGNDWESKRESFEAARGGNPIPSTLMALLRQQSRRRVHTRLVETNNLLVEIGDSSDGIAPEPLVRSGTIRRTETVHPGRTSPGRERVDNDEEMAG